MSELAESILRKIIDSDGYVALYKDSACIDGWVEKLTPDEVEYLATLGARWDRW